MDIVGQRIISKGVQSEIPCVNCGDGRYEAHCVTHLDGRTYEVLTCRSCGQWHYYDHYVNGRCVVQDHLGLDRVEWRDCPVTELKYMVVLRDVRGVDYWDDVIDALAEAGDDREKLSDLIINITSYLGVDMEYWDVERMSVRIMQLEIQAWIDQYGS